ncbi:MAG: glycerophosphodiester phosphodiesterase family protein [Arenimonas sp.]
MPDSPRRAPALVIAHRGASALLPEHTLAAYARAIADGADFIEPDLVCTRDGVLVARHEDEIGGTTDVAQHPHFAARHATRTIDGKRVSGWFASDFTLAELKTLRARERLPHLRSTAHDGEFEIPTLDEIVALLATATGDRVVGLMPEIKQPTYFRKLGLPMEEILLAQLDAHAVTRTAPVVIQSFETGNLRWLRERLDGRANVRLLQLIDKADRHPADLPGLTCTQMITREGLRGIGEYAHIVGVPLRAVVPLDADGALAAPTTLVDDAHAHGVQVMPYPYRPENAYLAPALRLGEDPRTVHEAGAIAEIRAALAAGIDGLFTDHPGIGRAAVDGA